MNNLWFINKVPANLREAFSQKLIEISSKLNIQPNWLMAIFLMESGVNPKAVNKWGGATGLIQFMPNTARGLGTSTANLLKMDHVQQLDYVYKFYKPYAKYLETGADMYLSTFYPLALRKPDNYVIGSEKGLNYARLVAKQNPVFMKYHTGDTMTKKQWYNALEHILKTKLKGDSEKLHFFFLKEVI